MSESYREQRPLLCEEDLTDEDQCSGDYQNYRRIRIYKGRSRAAAKGASVIFTRWPEHWTSLVSFWWLAVSMFAISTFIIYHTLIAFTIPTSHGRSLFRSFGVDNSDKTSIPNVYMHTFVNDKEQLNPLDFIHHIESFAANYTGFNFVYVVIEKDVNTDFDSISAEEHNAHAWNMLWTKENNNEPKQIKDKNIYIQNVTLSKYLDTSPLRKDWKRLPHQFIEFLVRAVAIWDKGGIAINPIILTPNSLNKNYLDKLKNILTSYGKSNSTKARYTLNTNNYTLTNVVNDNYNATITKVDKVNNKPKKYHKKVNNIRDIINILENDDLNSTQDVLVEAENTNKDIVLPSKRKLLSTSMQEVKDDLIIEPTSYKNIDPPAAINKKEDKDHNILKQREISSNIYDFDSESSHTMKKSPPLSLLPLFLEFIFNDKIDEPTPVHSARHRKSVIPIDVVENKPAITNLVIESDKVMKSDIEASKKFKPMIIEAKEIVPDKVFNKTTTTTEVNATLRRYDRYQLTVDLKGNILATETPCHAFLGTMFSNAVHHTKEESLNDFIIAELSLFCKGLLSSCKGIDLILL